MMRRCLMICIALLFLMPAGAYAGDEAGSSYYFPYLTGNMIDASPEYVFEFITLENYPLMGEVIADDFYVYEHMGEKQPDLGLYYGDGYSSHAYAEQLQAGNLYGYYISFKGLQREDVTVAKTFESGVQWSREDMGKVKDVNLVAGDQFYLMMEIDRDGGLFPYCRTAIDASGLALGESMTVEATFDFPEFQGEEFPITVTKQLWLRRPLEESAVEGQAESILNIADIIPIATEEPMQIIGEADVPLAGPELTLTAPEVSLKLQPSTTGYVRITNAYSVNLREAPDAESARVVIARPGEQYECVGVAENGWYELLLPDGRHGFVSPKMAELVTD